MINYELKALRAKHNYSQKKMADKLEMTVASYNRKENGMRNFTVTEANAVAKIFNTTIEKVFFVE